MVIIVLHCVGVEGDVHVHREEQRSDFVRFRIGKKADAEILLMPLIIVARLKLTRAGEEAKQTIHRDDRVISRCWKIKFVVFRLTKTRLIRFDETA